MGIYVGSEAVKVYGAGVYRGDDGGYYTPSISQHSSTSLEVSYTPSSTDMPSVPKTVVTLPKGDPGYTPVKGTDYWTEADIAEIKSYVDEAILGGAW